MEDKSRCKEMNTVEASGASTGVRVHSQEATCSLQILCLKNQRLIITQFANWKFVNRTRFCCVLQMGFIFQIDTTLSVSVIVSVVLIVSLNPRKETTPVAGFWKLPGIFMLFLIFFCYFSVQKISLFLGSLFFFKSVIFLIVKYVE